MTCTRYSLLFSHSVALVLKIKNKPQMIGRESEWRAADPDIHFDGSNLDSHLYSITMVVGGPNSRNDYHVNQTEEWFYQVKGDMLLKVVVNDEFQDVKIAEGEMFLLPRRFDSQSQHLFSASYHRFELSCIYLEHSDLHPASVPHNPCRFADTVGLVMERKRPKDSIDRLRWYCPNAEAHPQPHLIREVSFHCEDLGTQLKPLINDWMSNESLRQCNDCGQTAPPH